ncbi:MAG TPA: hypothetical protein VD963_04425, partial [Phycisphaerales bacterium]|nr:hypothetical protein [Phycisphaerales bacterium]
MNADLPARDDDQPPDGLPGPPGPPSLPARARPLRRRRRTLRAAALAAAAVLGAGVMTAVLLVRATPSWWQPPDPADARVQIIAAELEQGATAQLQRVRPEAGSGAPGSGAWTVHLSEDEANAWLAARLPDWIASRSRDFRWPEQLGRVQVDFRDGLVCLGAEVFASSGGRNPAAGQHVSASVRPVMTRNGALWTPARAFYVGRLPVPASLVLDEPAPS